MHRDSRGWHQGTPDLDAVHCAVNPVAPMQVQTDPSGIVIVTQPDGHMVQSNPDGVEIVTRLDGSTLQTNPDGSTVTTLLDGTMVCTHCDGSVYKLGSDGQVAISVAITISAAV